MSDVFLFQVLRPVAVGMPLDVAPTPALSTQVAAAFSSADTSAAVATLVAEHRRAVGSALAAEALIGELLALSGRLRRERDPVARRSLATAGASLAAPAERTAVASLIGDALVLARLESRDGLQPTADLVEVLRVLAVLHDPDLAEGPWERRVVRVSGPIVQRSLGRPGAGTRPRTTALQRAAATSLRALSVRRSALRSLIDRLHELGPDDLAGPAEHRRSAPPDAAPAARLSSGGAPAGPGDHVEGDGAIGRVGSPLALAAATITGLPAALRNELGLAGGQHLPLPQLLDRLKAHAERLDIEIAGAEATAHVDALGREALLLVGNNVVRRRTLMHHAMPTPQLLSTQVLPDAVRPAGVADLIVVRSRTLGYESDEVAYIENVLASERRLRTHRRTDTQETVEETETEHLREEELDTQTTERFELQRELTQQLTQDASLSAGLTFTASYGPAVEVSGNTEAAVSTAREEASRVASNFSRDVTTRAVQRLSDRTRSLRRVRTARTVEELNEHAFDNTAGSEHVVGVYQWLSKIVEHRLVNYGRRMLIDVVVPEPGALWLHAMAGGALATVSMTEPPPFDVGPEQIEPGTYTELVARFEATGVNAPPSPFVSLSKTFDGTVQDKEFGTTRIADIPVTAGYRAIRAFGATTSAFLSDYKDTWAISTTIGQRVWVRRHTTAPTATLDLDGEEGTVPVTVRSGGVFQWVVSFEILCERTERALAAWRLEVFAALQEGSMRQQRRFQDQLSAVKADARRTLASRNPTANRDLVLAELKRNAITLMANQPFTSFGAIGTSPSGNPTPLVPEALAEGRYIKFVEQAIEWSNLLFSLLDYFWAREATWVDKILLDDPDPEFASFLRAGAARVVLPVRPGFEAAVVHFLETGQVWQGGPLQSLAGTGYADMLADIADVPDGGVEVGRRWTIEVPTNLVMVRADGSLPTQAPGTPVEPRQS